MKYIYIYSARPVDDPYVFIGQIFPVLYFLYYFMSILKVLSNKNQQGSKLVSLDRSSFKLGSPRIS
jgi:hypothetical protein